VLAAVLNNFEGMPKEEEERQTMMEDKVVLVIEDNALNMKLVVTLLTLNKLKVLCAEDANSGLRMAQEHRPDLILMDIQLPGMDGLAATRFLKRSPDLKDIPVIALTGYAMQGDMEKSMAAGCSGYIAKPIDTRSFIEQIRPFLDGNRADKTAAVETGNV
jgi:CheY-like chemotaxis protein